MIKNHLKYIIIGYSGHSYELIETLINKGEEVVGYYELIKKIKNPYKLKYLGDDDDIFKILNKNTFSFAVGIGNNQKRVKISSKLRLKGLTTLNIFDRSSLISNSLEIGVGNFVSKNVIINSQCVLGDDIIINSGAIIEHECIISDGCHIAPGSVLCGNVKVGEKTLIGANSVIKEGIKIGSNSIIGAGSVVTSNVKSNSIIYGNPAK